MVQAVLRGETQLRDRAIALVEGAPPLVRVVAATEAALRAGIQLGMAKLQAQLCGVEIRQRSRTQEKAAHAALLDLGWSISPRIEDHAPETIIVDVAGLASLFGSHENIAHEIVQRAAGLGLLAHLAVAANLETAMQAARGFPGITLIPAGEEEKCLSSLPVGRFRLRLRLWKRWIGGAYEPVKNWRRCRCWSFQNDWGRKEFVCMNWRAERVHGRSS